MPPEELTSHAVFHENADEFREGNQKADPYGQGFSMSRYLGYVLKGGKLSDFLKLIGDKKSFEVALKESTGMTVSEFYASWLKAVSEINLK